VIDDLGEAAARPHEYGDRRCQAAGRIQRFGHGGRHRRGTTLLPPGNRLLPRVAGAREPGFDAEGPDGRRYQIKARALSETSRRKSQMLGSIKLAHTWDAVLFVLMDEHLNTLEIWEADRGPIEAALSAPGSRARNERGALAMSKFKQIGKKVWRT
jgi:hypothetical protein